MKKLTALWLLLLVAFYSKANNVQISNVSFSGNNISFTISWENSWNTTNNTDPNYPSNWDGVWVFIKYQRGDNLWRHAPLSTVSADHSAAGGILQVDAVTDGIGVFIRRSNPGAGNISATTVTLLMGTLQGTGPANFRVFGAEMVYCPTGAFTIGDGSPSSLGLLFIMQTITAASQTNGIPANALFAGSISVPNTFPMGYYGFYIMKYECSNEQYADFLNTLTYDQQASRTNVAPNSATGTRALEMSSSGNLSTATTRIIEIMTPGQYNTVPAVFGCDWQNNGVYNTANDGQNIALGGISGNDLRAWLDWSGLRPMTEMEYEKACRGTKGPIEGEFAWGSTAFSPYTRYANVDYAPATNGSAQETVYYDPSLQNGRCFGGSTATGANSNNDGTARCGIFATGTSGRSNAGAGFFGAMELSGSLYELCVPVANTVVGFTGNQGNGTLSNIGDADVILWPTNFTSFFFDGNLRGGVWWDSDLTHFKVSRRISNSPPVSNNIRSASFGIRGVRTYY